VWILAAPFGAAGLDAWATRLRRGNRARSLLVAALVVPTSLLVTIGFLRDPRSPRSLVAGEIAEGQGPIVATSDEEGAHRLIEGLSREVVVIESPRPTVNEPIPVLAARRVFCGSLDVYLGNHFGASAAPGGRVATLLEEFEIRRGIQRTLFSGAALDEGQRLYLDSFAAPLLLVLRREDHPAAVGMAIERAAEWQVVFDRGSMAVFTYRGAAAR
jgi:hypothetical protein